MAGKIREKQKIISLYLYQKAPQVEALFLFVVFVILSNNLLHKNYY